ncbi:AAA family ATPase [Staphylococcus coagulans]|uniref:AAA family ATPase n=1 Tax=Staphylococcus coagulans TaxID=74706 RepID=UPI001FD9E2A2|nr:AAA family ATPase [Staphylococcus coagulans]
MVKKNVEIENEITELKNEIVDVTDTKNLLVEKRKKLREKINDIHRSRKGNLKIALKASNKSIEEVITIYKNNLEEAEKIEPNKESIKNFVGDNEALQHKYNRIYELVVPRLKIETYEVDRLKEILQNNYTDIKIPSFEVINWLRNGLELHNAEENKCKFCGNNFNYNLIKEKIEIYISNEKKKDFDYLIDVKKSMEEILDRYDQYLSKIEQNEFFVSELGVQKTEKENLRDSIEEIMRILKQKLENMENDNLKFPSDNYITLISRLSEIEEECKDKKKTKLKELHKKMENINVIVTGSIGLEILENQSIKKELLTIQNKEEECKEQEQLNMDINLKISQLQEEQSDYSDFKNYLNDIFESINLHIRLESDETTQNYYLYHSLEKVSLKIKDISEGEKNLLAFLFFYFELFEDDKQKNVKSNISTLIIDDPINSFDEANRFFVLEMIKKIMKNKFDQVFIFTHSWNDFCDITYGLKGGKYNFYEVNKDHQGFSFIEKIKKVEKPYKKLFQEIYKLSNKDKKDILDDDCYYYHSINGIRRVFEEFLSFKLKNNHLPQKSNQSEIEEVYRKMTGNEMSNNQKIKLGSFLTIINVLSHKPYRAIDVIESAKFLMKYIEEVDKAHFDAMKD